MASKELNVIPISIDDISIPEISLRNVRKDSDEFQNLVTNIYEYGVLQNITVIQDPKDPNKYILEDGKHRLTASIMARDIAKEKGDKKAISRVQFIPARIMEHTLEEVPMMQIISNLMRVETKPTEFATQIKRIWALPRFQGMTKAQLFAHLGIKKTVQWFDNQMGLANLCDAARELVDQEKISISSAYMLAKLPPDEQIAWLDRAMSDNTTDFANAVTARLQEIRAAKKGEQHIKDPLDDIKPRKRGEFKDKIITLTEELNQHPDDKTKVAFAQGIMWGCSLDDETVKAKEAKEKAEKEKKDKILEARRAKLLELRKSNIGQINEQIEKELNLPEGTLTR